MKRQSTRAAAQSDDPRARAVGFLMSLYQRRLASSTHAMKRSLENRVKRLGDGLERAQDLVRTAPPNLPDPEELEELEDAERERLEEMLEAITLAGNAEQVREEIAELQQLAEEANEVLDSGSEAKLGRLREIMRDEGFFDRPDQRLLLFTEFKDTLSYLMEQLQSWGFIVGCIHGGMKSGSRDEPGSRIHTEQQFREGAIPGPGGDRGSGRRHQPSVLSHSLQLRYSLEPEPARTAHGPHPPLRTAAGLLDLQLRCDEHHRGTGAPAPSGQAPGDPQSSR